MAVIAMRRLSFIGLRKDKEEILSKLQSLGIVEVSRMPDSSALEQGSGELAEEIPEDFDEEHEIEDKLTPKAVEIVQKRSHLMSGINELTEYDTRKKPLFAVRRPITESEMAEVAACEDELTAKADRIAEIRSEITSLQTEGNRLLGARANLQEWIEYPESFIQSNTRLTRTVFLTVSDVNEYKAIVERIGEDDIAADAMTVNADRNNVCFVVTYHKSDEERVQQLLNASNVTRCDMSQYYGTPKQCLEETDKAIERNKNDIDKLMAETQSLAEELPKLEVLYDYLGMELEREKASVRMCDTAATFVFDGWLPKRAEKYVTVDLPEEFICHVEVRDPKEGEKPPTALDNNVFASAVEPIESMYSILAYGALDPSMISSFFFALFFGFMLSDAGYGIIVTLACAAILMFAKLERTTRRYMTLFMFSGISTIFWGALFGSWFGNLLPTLTLGELAIKPLWFDPTDSANTEHFLAFTLLIGVVHIFVALAIKAAGMIAKGKWLDALCDVGFWYIFYIGEILFLMPYIPYYGKMDFVAKYSPYGVWILLAGFVLILFTKGRKSKNIFVKLFGGITCLYSLVDMLSDALSYTRLMAMGLATSVIINVFNEIAATAGGVGAGGITIRFVFFVIIFLAANIFNLAISALSSYVNSCRLTYIEFFGKFYEGDGREFEPLCRNTEYVYIESARSA